MIEQAWNEYRGWAKRARSLQAKTDRWNFWALFALVVTGALGAASGFFGANATDWLPGWLSHGQFATALACAAAVASALSLYVGRQALAVSAESGWLRARATAEAIKSECFRFAGGVSDYWPDDAFDGDAAGDDRRPSHPMTDKWYLTNRIDGQIAFYKQGQEKNESAYQRLQLWSFVAGAVIAAVSAVAAVYGARFAAWTGALTTVGAAVGAYGLAERQKSLAASYAAMKANLERLKERYLVGGASLQALVAIAEDLMESEHAAWIDQMAKTIRPAASSAPQAGGTSIAPRPSPTGEGLG